MVNLNGIVLLIAVGFLACTQDREEWAGRVIEVGGVLRVENPPNPVAAPNTISAELLWSSSGPAEGEIWEAPNQVHADDGFIYVLDRLASRVHRLSLDGETRTAFGEEGEGPGQYRRIIDVVPTEAGLFVVDGGNGRVEVLDSSGEIVGSGLLGQIVFSVVPLGPGAILVSGLFGRERKWQRIDAIGDREPFDFPIFEDPEALEDTPSRAWSWGDRLVRLRFTSPQIQFFSPAGELEKVVDIPLPPEEATEEEVESLVSEMASVLASDGLPSAVIQQQAQQFRSRPRAKYRFRGIRFDDSLGLAAIWEQNPEDFGSGNASLHLLSIGGIYLGAIEFGRAWSSFELENGVLYALTRDPNTDLVTLQAFELSIPEGLLFRADEFTSPRSY